MFLLFIYGCHGGDILHWCRKPSTCLKSLHDKVATNTPRDNPLKPLEMTTHNCINLLYRVMGLTLQYVCQCLNIYNILLLDL